MSRHRRERVPRHRAQRSPGYPARRAEMTAAVRPWGSALDGAEDDAGIGLSSAETAPLAALTASWDGAFAGLGSRTALDDDAMPEGPPPGRRPASHSRRGSRQSARTPNGSAPASGLADKHPGVARGLLMTPWFAAATGFVIAASLWIYSPHPQLTYPAISKVPCRTSGCRPQADQQGAGSLTIKSGQQVRRQHKSAAPTRTSTRTRASTAASGLTFGYVVRPAADGKFWLTVIITGKRPIKDWRLAFVLPGAHIQSVYGADWHSAGGDGGTASQFAGDPGEQHGGPGGGGSGRADQGGQGSAYGPGGAGGQTRVFFTVLASGEPVGPTHCSFNGASCTFGALSGGAGQGGR